MVSLFVPGFVESLFDRNDVPDLLSRIPVHRPRRIADPFFDLHLIAGQGHAKIADRPAVGMDQIEHGFDRCRLPRSVSADESGDPALFDAERHRVQLERRILFHQILHFYNTHRNLRSYDLYD